MSQNIDPIVFARFMVMDGATRLVTAFSGIPEGPLRESVIHMAETMCATYAGAPVKNQAPDPLATLGVATPPAPAARRALSGPGPKTADPMTKAVQMRLEGKYPHEIAEATGLKVGLVYKAIGEARKAGLKLPNIGRAKPGLTPRHVTYVTDLDQITGPQMMGSINRAAAARGISAEEYVGRRGLALKMGLDGRHIRAIMAATGEDKGTLSQWFHVAREAGHPVAYMVDQQYVSTLTIDDEPPESLAAIAKAEGITIPDAVVEEPAPKPANVVTLKPKPRKRSGDHKSFVVLLEDYERGGGHVRMSINKGAKLMGLDVPDYLRKRREALTMFETGSTSAQVAERLNLTNTQASNWRERAYTAGLISSPYQRKA